MVKVPIGRRQVNPAAFSGVTDQISNVGTAAGNKAAKATSGLTRTQTFILVVMVIIAFVLGVAALFWLCSFSRRRKRAREMKEKSQQLTQVSSSSPEAAFVPANSAAPAPKRDSRRLGAYNNDGWGESRVALNSSFVASNNDRYGWGQGQAAMPQTPQQTYRY